MTARSATRARPAPAGSSPPAPPPPLPLDGPERRPGRFHPPGTSTTTFWLLAATIVVLNMVGLVMIMSASSVVALSESGSTWYYFVRQVGYTVPGTLALLVFVFTDLGRWRRLSPLLLLGSLLALGAVLAPGVGNTVNGATRWVQVGPVAVQPSEFAKLALILFVADLLTRRARAMADPALTVWPVIGYLSVTIVLILLQPNLGTPIVMATSVLAVVYVAGGRARTLAACSIAAAGLVAVLVFSTPYRKARFLSFLNPWADPENTGYQVIQAGVGFADGGVWGIGLGTSRAKYDWLPFAHTDFIFAIIGEELGLIGAALTIALFVALGTLGISAALRAADRFAMLVATGITTWFGVQAFVNIAAVTGMMPITGVPLPFISSGGSSLVVNLAASGLLLNVARHPRTEPPATAAARRRAAAATR